MTDGQDELDEELDRGTKDEKKRSRETDREVRTAVFWIITAMNQ